ncbi:hypothetical protein D9M72_452230 [compost metagenome]
MASLRFTACSSMKSAISATPPVPPCVMRPASASPRWRSRPSSSSSQARITAWPATSSSGGSMPRSSCTWLSTRRSTTRATPKVAHASVASLARIRRVWSWPSCSIAVRSPAVLESGTSDSSTRWRTSSSYSSASASRAPARRSGSASTTASSRMDAGMSMGSGSGSTAGMSNTVPSPKMPTARTSASLPSVSAAASISTSANPQA